MEELRAKRELQTYEQCQDCEAIVTRRHREAMLDANIANRVGAAKSNILQQVITSGLVEEH